MSAQILRITPREYFKIESALNRRGNLVFKLCHVGEWGDLVLDISRTKASSEAALREWQINYPHFEVVRCGVAA